MGEDKKEIRGKRVVGLVRPVESQRKIFGRTPRKRSDVSEKERGGGEGGSPTRFFGDLVLTTL